jgi:dTMP kinase
MPLITFEGLDGAGKSTQVKLLVERIKKEFPDKEVIVTHHPGGTPMTERWRQDVKGLSEGAEKISPLAQFYLLQANALVHCEHVIQPALDKGSVVICDRYIPDTTLAYQIFGGELSQVLFNDAIKMNAFPIPNLSIYLQQDVKNIKKRISERGDIDTKDVFENAKEEFHTKVAFGYETLIKLCTCDDRFYTIKASEPIEVVHEAIWSMFCRKLKLESKTSDNDV